MTAGESENGKKVTTTSFVNGSQLKVHISAPSACAPELWGSRTHTPSAGLQNVEKCLLAEFFSSKVPATVPFIGE